MTTALQGGEWSAAHPGRTLPPGKTRYPFYRRLGGLQGRSGRAENLAPPGFNPRIVQPVVSRYTDCATRPRTRYVETKNEYHILQITQFIRKISPFSCHFLHLDPNSLLSTPLTYMFWLCIIFRGYRTTDLIILSCLRTSVRRFRTGDW